MNQKRRTLKQTNVKVAGNFSAENSSKRLEKNFISLGKPGQKCSNSIIRRASWLAFWKKIVNVTTESSYCYENKGVPIDAFCSRKVFRCYKWIVLFWKKGLIINFGCYNRIVLFWKKDLDFFVMKRKCSEFWMLQLNRIYSSGKNTS